MITIRPHLNSLTRTSGDTEERKGFIRLDKNERIVPFPQQLWSRFIQLLEQTTVMSYPELEPLYQKLAERLSVDRNHLFLTAGSDLGIKTIYETYVNPGDEVILHSPTYAMQEVYVKIFQARPFILPFNQNLTLDIKRFSDAITNKTRLVVLENPNGFTGTLLMFDAVRIIVKKANQCNAIVLLDEAYYQFSGQTAMSLYREFDNVVVTRSFSKDFGAAGLRCAYVLSQSHNIDGMLRVKPMHEINSAAAAFTLACLEFPDLINQHVEQVKKGLQYLRESFRRMGLLMAGGAGNFLVVYVGDNTDGAILTQYLKSKGILVRRPFQATALQGWVRVGAGAPEQLKPLIDHFPDALAAAGWRQSFYQPLWKEK